MVLKKIEIAISNDEFKEIANINLGEKYDFSIEDDKYIYILRFTKGEKYSSHKELFDVYIEIKDKTEVLKSKSLFTGSTELWSLVDKVFVLNVISDDIKVLIKLSNGDTIRQNFLGSMVTSKKINSIGNINLYNHILYTDFNDDIEIIELCFKYCCFFEFVLGKKPYTEINNLLDNNLSDIKIFLQQKLEYYGYYSLQELNEILGDMRTIEEKRKEETKTKQDIKNKIILLTQCLMNVATTTPSLLLANEVLAETEKYAQLL